LRILDLRANPVANLPAAIASLPRLDKLDLRWVTRMPGPDWLADLAARGCLIYR
jgi:hypothetical protein